VINGLLQRDMKGQPLIPVGLIPGGSGNSTMLDLGTWSVAEAARRIGRGDVMWSDIIALTTGNKTVCSVNLVAWGLLGDIGVLAELFRCLGTSRYDIVGVWGILKGGGVDCKITYEHNGESKVMEEKLITGNVNLTQHFGKGLRPFPNARLDDGLMDLFVMKGTATRGELLTIFTQLPTGAQYEKNIGKTMFQSKKVIVELGTHGVVNVDGEVMKHNGTLLMENVSQIVPIFCPHTYEPVDVPQAEAGRATGWKP
jgi:diacylglycerol kinase family enzyme